MTEFGNLLEYADPDEIESARAAIREIACEVSVVEKDPNVFAYTKLNKNMGYNGEVDPIDWGHGMKIRLSY